MGLRLRARWWALIFTGGALGTTARALLEKARPADPGGWPSTTLAINLLGSLILGALLEWLLRGGPDEGWRRQVRLGVGTGVLGGFTTYSTFIVEIDQRLQSGHLAVAVGYAVVSVVAGLTLAGLGMRLAARRTSVAPW